MNVHDLSLVQLRDLADQAVLIAAASEAGIFRALADGPSTPSELAARLEYDERAVRITLQALAEAGLLRASGDGRFAPTDRCAAELCDPDSPDYAGGGLPLWLRSIRAWTRLSEVLRRGGPLEPRPKERSPEDVARFMAGMAAAPRARVEKIVELCLARHPEARSVLDVGGGPGHMARTFVEKGLEATLFDTRDILAYVADAYGLHDVAGLTLVAGDFREDPLPPGPFDIVLISNVMHIYSAEENRALVRHAAEVLAPGGVLAIAEFVRGRSGKAARFGVQMLLRSEGGDAYSGAEFAEWIQAAGLGDMDVEDVDPDRQLITARKVRPQRRPTAE
ncbi:MAG: methyltransferase [Gemmatimonadota bacterium]